MLSILIRTVAATLALTATAFAQTDFPKQPVTIVVPYGPGGSTDVNVRILARGLEELWKQPVIIENRPGAGSLIGTSYVARSKPDGYTMLATTGAFVTLPAVRDDMPYDTIADFSGISMFVDLPIVIVAPPTFGPVGLPELIEEAKKRSANPISYASAGFSTYSHMIGELLQDRFNLKLLHVPYTGAAAAAPDVISGRVDVLITPWSDARPQVESGKLKLVAVLSRTRLPEYPEVPTASEKVDALGTPGSAFNGLSIPSKVPNEIKAKIAKDVATITSSEKFKKSILELGATPSSTSPEETDAFVKDQVATWTKIAKAANIHQK